MPAFILAMGINTLLFTGTGHRMQSSIINYDGAVTSNIQTSVTSDLRGSINTNVALEQIDAIHMTLLYDPDTLFLDEIQNDLPNGTLVQVTETSPLTITLAFDTPYTIEKNTPLFTYQVIKLTPESRNINISGAYFTKENQRYELSASGSGSF